MISKSKEIRLAITVDVLVRETDPFGATENAVSVIKGVGAFFSPVDDIVSLEQLQNWIGGAQDAASKLGEIAARDAFNGLYLQQQGVLIKAMHEAGTLYPEGIPSEEAALNAVPDPEADKAVDDKGDSE